MYHIPVLFDEVLAGLDCQHGGIFLDCTLGGGGHTRGILEQHINNIVIGIDRDLEVLQLAQHELQSFGERVSFHHARYEHLDQVLQRIYPDRFSVDDKPEDGWLHGILFDLGLSSFQMDTPDRGFSFQQAAQLDMRMDRQATAQTAQSIVNTYAEEQLANVFFQYGEERFARRIARKIVETRATQPIATTDQLADLVFRAVPRRFHPHHIHPATRVFQALRIEVNDELRLLGVTLERAVRYLHKGGRICVISFHSLEDRIVKQTFAKLAKGCQCPPKFPICVCGITPSLQILSRKPMIATADEQQRNPRSRSAKLRIAQKI